MILNDNDNGGNIVNYYAMMKYVKVSIRVLKCQ